MFRRARRQMERRRLAALIRAAQPATTRRGTGCNSAFGQDWTSTYPELVFAVVPAENASGVMERYGPFVVYLAKELGTKVALRLANDDGGQICKKYRRARL